MGSTQKSEGICTKCTRLCFNTTLLFAFLFFIMIIVLHSYVSKWNYLVNPGSQDILNGFSNFFAAMFAIFYLAASLVILRRYCTTKRLCRLDNCSFYILTTGIFVLGLVGRDFVSQAYDAHAEDFSYSCAELALADKLPENSLLAEINQVYHNAEALLCTAECPCAFRGGLNDFSTGLGPAIPSDDGDRRSLRFVTDPVGPTTVRKCATYKDRVFAGDEDKLWQYEEVFMKVEEDHVCSGICLGIDDKPFDYFLFSNVNDGAPLVTCRGPIEKTIQKNIEFYGRLYLVAVVLTGNMLGLLIILLFWQIHVYCQRKCGRKGPSKKEIKKNRAKNGMVVGGDDQESEDDHQSAQKQQPKVEMADLEGKEAGEMESNPAASESESEKQKQQEQEREAETKQQPPPAKRKREGAKKSDRPVEKKVDSQVLENQI